VPYKLFASFSLLQLWIPREPLGLGIFRLSINLCVRQFGRERHVPKSHNETCSPLMQDHNSFNEKTFFQTGFHCVACASLELEILLSTWDYRCAPPCPFQFFKKAQHHQA
jgi:hypothetical protein